MATQSDQYGDFQPALHRLTLEFDQFISVEPDAGLRKLARTAQRILVEEAVSTYEKLNDVAAKFQQSYGSACLSQDLGADEECVLDRSIEFFEKEYPEALADARARISIAVFAAKHRLDQE